MIWMKGTKRFQHAIGGYHVLDLIEFTHHGIKMDCFSAPIANTEYGNQDDHLNLAPFNHTSALQNV